MEPDSIDFGCNCFITRSATTAFLIRSPSWVDRSTEVLSPADPSTLGSSLAVVLDFHRVERLDLAATLWAAVVALATPFVGPSCAALAALVEVQKKRLDFLVG